MIHQGAVLIIDQDLTNLEYLSRVLGQQGYQVRSISRGEQAISAATEHTPDVILLDLRMPAPDGLELGRRFKADECCRSIPLIFLGSPRESEAIEGTKLGAVDWLYKPLRPNEVLARVSICLERSRRQRLEDNSLGDEPLGAGASQTLEELEAAGLRAIGVAHDFSSLLNSILVNSETVLEKLGANAPSRSDIEHIRSVALRASEMVSQLMNMGDRRSLRFEPTDLPVLVGEMVGLVRRSISRHCRIETIFSDDVPPVRVDRVQMQQVILNLLWNAAEAIGDCEGVISLRVQTLLILAGDSRAMPEGVYVCLDVSDTGCGMTEETRARVFEPFFTTKFAGRGLGLTSLRKIVASHQGGVAVASALGQGTTFQVLLPAWQKCDMAAKAD